MISAASYGWVSRLPAQTINNKLLKCLSKTTGFQQRMASFQRRQILLGGTLDLKLRAVSNMIRRASRQLQKGILKWRSRPSTTTGLLRKFLTKEGWTAQAPWQFRHSSAHGLPAEREINLRQTSDLLKDLHAVRTQWCHNRVSEWVSGSRHEAEAALKQYVVEDIHAQFDEVDLRTTRDACNSSGEHRALQIRTALLSAASVGILMVRMSASCSSACLSQIHRRLWKRRTTGTIGLVGSVANGGAKIRHALVL